MLFFVLREVNCTKTNIVQFFNITNVILIFALNQQGLLLIFCGIIFLVEKKINIRLGEGLLNLYIYIVALNRRYGLNDLFIPIFPFFGVVFWQMNKIHIQIVNQT